MDKKQFFREELDQVRRKRDSLPTTSHVRAAFTDEILDEIAADIEASTADELERACRPMIFGYVWTLAPNKLKALDRDIDLILPYVPVSNRNAVASFLRLKLNERPGAWYGGLFDVWAKATLLKKASGVLFDHPLLNGRNSDICIDLNHRPFRIESTVITEDDEHRGVWKRYINAKREGYDKPLIRPGPFCPPNAKGPSPYYLPLRLYAKAFDKVAAGLNPDKSQFSDDGPNILLVSFSGVGMRPTHPGASWAWDELFAIHPRRTESRREGFQDTSLEGWLEHTAAERIEKGTLDPDWYYKNAGRILTSLNRLSGIVIFSGSTLVNARVNYNARAECQISHAEIAKLERMLKRPASYWWAS